MKILVPVDGSEYSRAAVEFVASRSTLIGTEPQVELINVQFAVPVRAARVVGKSALSEYYESESDKVLKPALRRLQKAGLSATARYPVGNPGEEISAAAVKDGVDLIVMGAHGHTALGGLLIGWSWFAICSIMFGGRWLHFGAPVETVEQVAQSVPTPAK